MIKHRATRLSDRRHGGILEIIHRKLPRPLPARRIKIADLKLPQHAIHRRFRVRLRGVFAHKIGERRQTVRGTNTGKPSPR